MPSEIPPKPRVEVTPRQILAYTRLGTGVDRDPDGYQDFLDEHGTEVAREIRRIIEEFTGYSTSELHQLAPEMSDSRTIVAEEIRDKIRGRLMEKLKRDPVRLHRLRDSADDFIREVIRNFFPNEDVTSMNDEAATPRDPAKVVLRGFNDNLTPKIKFESARKAVLMKLLAECSDYHEQPIDDEDALEFMTDFFNEDIIKLEEGQKIGHLHDRFLVSHHEGENLETTKAEFLEEIPEHIDSKGITRITYMECRRTEINGRPAFFRKHPRKKSPESRLIKALRKNAMIGEKDLDRYGIRLVFANKAEWLGFFEMFQEKLKERVAKGLHGELETLEKEYATLTDEIAKQRNRDKRKTLKNRLSPSSLESSVRIYDYKDSLDGNRFEGNSDSSSPDLKMVKFKLQLTLADGRIYNYEFQVLLPDGYADYLYRKGVSWEEYNVDRFFHEKVDELFFPKRIYPKLDRQKAYEKAMKAAYRKVWTENGNGSGKGSASPQNQRYEEHWEDTDEGED